ncbi:MAG: multidrug effflux MFS transporter [Legionellales bacterium]|nr:multidrug effflux MFS transporter [Legionellales bacterium]
MKNKNGFIIGLVLILVVSNSTFSSDIYLPSLPEMASYFSIPSRVAQLTLSIYMFGFALSVLLAGSLSDRFGRKKILITGLTMHLIASIACVFSPSIMVLIVLRFFQALGGCCGTVLARVIVRDSYDQTTSIRMLSSISAGLSVALVIAPIFGGLIQTHFGWRGSFVFISIFSITLLLLSLVFIKETAEKDNIIPLNISNLVSAYFYALKNRNFVCYTLIISLAWGAFFSFVCASPFIFINGYNFSPSTYGLMYGFIVLSYISGALIARKFSSKIGTYHSVSLAVWLSFFAGIFMVLSPFLHYQIFYVCMFIFLYIGAIGLVMPNCQAGAISEFKTSIGTISSLFYFIEMMFGGIFSFLVGHMFNGNFLLAVSTLMFTSGVLMLISLWFLSRKDFSIKSSLIVFKRRQSIL